MSTFAILLPIFALILAGPTTIVTIVVACVWFALRTRQSGGLWAFRKATVASSICKRVSPVESQ